MAFGCTSHFEEDGTCEDGQYDSTVFTVEETYFYTDFAVFQALNDCG
jgi:hypothetical protein